MIRSSLIAFLVIFVLIPTIQADDNPDHSELLSKHYRLEKPVGPGPFPAIMLVPGCSGFDAKFAKARYDQVQSRLVELGFVTLRVNYLAARNASSCYPDVPTEEVAGDICIAAEYLRQQPFVKKGAINILGWSWGGASALQALGRTSNRDPVQVDAVVTYSPGCAFVQEKWESEAPVLVLAGALDNVTPLTKCNYLFSGLPSHRLTVRVYDNAHHGFDNFQLPAEMPYRFGTIGYNEAAAKSAWKEVTCAAVFRITNCNRNKTRYLKTIDYDK
jgi:dienelactone hydrolase